MFTPPPLPSTWDALHPLVVHFPIALLLIAPLFVLLAIVSRAHTGTWLAAATLLMLLAAGGALVATSTGSAAEGFAERVPGVRGVLEEHEELGEATRNFALALAGALLIGTAAYRVWGARAPRSVVVGLGVVYLLAGGAGALVAANAAHEGGRLVHEFGVRARLAGDGTPSSVPGDARRDDEGRPR